MNITIYTNETCPYCKAVKEELEKQNIKFLNRLTSEYPDDWNDIVSLTGIPTVPTIVHKGKGYVHMDHEENGRPIIRTIDTENIYVPGRDFPNAQALVNRLKSYVPSKYTESKQTLEKIKTLNYNINVAFSRVDQLLKQIETKIK